MLPLLAQDIEIRVTAVALLATRWRVRLRVSSKYCITIQPAVRARMLRSEVPSAMSERSGIAAIAGRRAREAGPCGRVLRLA